MSDTYLPEVSYEEHPGFQSALLLNMSEYYPNHQTPKKDLLDSVESCRLSIESLTPGTTPRAAEKKGASNFHFCLSKDLMQRLETSSPYPVYSERNGLTSDLCFLNAESEAEGKVEDEEKIKSSEQIGLEYNQKSSFFNFCKNSNASTLETAHSRKRCEYHLDDDMVRTLSFEAFEEESEKNANSTNYNSAVFNNNLHQGVFSSYGKNITSNAGRVMNNMFINSAFYPKNGSLVNNGGYNAQAAGYSKFAPMYEGAMPNMMDNNQKVNLNMYGKNGWVCGVCNNFNYEIRIKCNRCGKGKHEAEKRAVLTNNSIKMPNEAQTKSKSSNNILNNAQNINNHPNSSQKKKKPFVERAGDWTCSKCKNLNFSFRVVCNRCQLCKKESEKLGEQVMKGINVSGSNNSINESGSGSDSS